MKTHGARTTEATTVHPAPKPEDQGSGRQRIQITDPSELPFLASIAHVATVLGVSERQLYTWRGRGEGPKWIRQGDRIQYPKAGVIRYLEDIGALEPTPARWRRAR